MQNIAPEAEWKVWYQDTFDRECPRQIEVSGQGLVEGLVELWARHLTETVQANGSRGFARFNLWLQEELQSIVIDGDWDGLVQLRGWMEVGGRSFLRRVACAHAALIQRGGECNVIPASASKIRNRSQFEHWLDNLA